MPYALPPPEQELMRRVQRRDAMAFEKLYYLMSPVIRKFVVSRGSPAWMAEDIAQEVFCRIWQQPERFKGRGAAKTYILGIALNVLRNYCYHVDHAAKSRKQLVQLARIGGNSSEQEQREELSYALRLARQSLPSGQSEAVTLVYDGGLRPAQAAKVAGCTEKALRRRLEKGRWKLYLLLVQRLSQQGAGPRRVTRTGARYGSLQ
jgi:RNA polymerase sigma-70 factor (ECF subfamily)